jgi:hypothetical protein
MFLLTHLKIGLKPENKYSGTFKVSPLWPYLLFGLIRMYVLTPLIECKTIPGITSGYSSGIVSSILIPTRQSMEKNEENKELPLFIDSSSKGRILRFTFFLSALTII